MTIKLKYIPRSQDPRGYRFPFRLFLPDESSLGALHLCQLRIDFDWKSR